MDKLERGWWEADRFFVHHITLEELADKLDEIVEWINKKENVQDKARG